ncbi:MAG: hypothetical protein D6815_02335 [Candidatus Dadabacteria bacterium]|nr:MAG: hypothetical protein D6815_02335 [Candidatus Dadabacteria bacterium]
MTRRLGLLVVVCAYFAWFLGYGLQVEDEGLLLIKIDRVLRGQVPYLDFHTGYTPGYFYLATGVFRALGEKVGGLRLALAAVNAASAMLIYSLCIRLARPWLAALVALGWVAFLPVFPGEFASFNIPYPAWFATLAWLLAALALVRWLGGASHVLLSAVGGVAAAAFAFKPNSGVYLLIGSLLVVLCATRRTRSYDYGVVALACGVALSVVASAFALSWHAGDALLHLVPLAALVFLVWPGTAEGPPVMPALLRLGIGFAVPTVLWALPFTWWLGLRGFAENVLMIGSNAAQVYYRPLPRTEPYALAVVAAALGSALVCRGVRKRRLSPGSVMTVATAGLLASVTAIGWYAVMPESFATSVGLQLENASFGLAAVATVAGLFLMGRRKRLAYPVCQTVTAVVPMGIAMYWQLYPRSDFMHLVNAVPLLAVVAAAALERVLRWWESGARESRLRAVPAATLGAAAVLVIILRVVPPVLAAAPCAQGVTPQLATPRLRACVEPQAADDLRSIARIVAFVREHAAPNDAVLAFPALGAIVFASERRPTGAHDYWFPGRPSHEDERTEVQALVADPPPLIVTLNDGWTFFERSPVYYERLREFAVSRYRLALRSGRYDVLLRRDLLPPGHVPRIEELPEASLADLVEPVLARRRQAARRWTAHLTPSDAAHAALPAPVRDAVLVLRAIRDGGDLRAAAWVVQGYERPEPRVHREAVAAMGRVATRFAASLRRWANDFDVSRMHRYVAPLARSIGGLRRADDPRVRAFATAATIVLRRGSQPEVKPSR